MRAWIKRFTVLSLVVLATFLNMLSFVRSPGVHNGAFGFSYFNPAQISDSSNTIPIGYYNLNCQLWALSCEVEPDFTGFADALYVPNNTTLGTLTLPGDEAAILAKLLETGNDNRPQTFTVNSVTFSGVEWSIFGYIVNAGGQRNTTGFIRQIDRTLPTSDLNATSFTVWDKYNPATNNDDGLRFENQVQLTSNNALVNLESVSFYVATGQGINFDRPFTISVSTNGTTFTTLYTATVTQTFTKYTVTFTETQAQVFINDSETPVQTINLATNDLYLRIFFDGPRTTNNPDNRSRMVLDELLVSYGRMDD